MRRDPVVIIAESIWIPRGVDYSRRHGPSLASRIKSAADLSADGETCESQALEKESDPPEMGPW